MGRDLSSGWAGGGLDRQHPTDEFLIGFRKRWPRAGREIELCC